MQIEQIAAQLTAEQALELDALTEANKAIGGDSFVSRVHWRGLYSGLVRKGLVVWRNPPEPFSRRRFAGTHVTSLGLAVHFYLQENNHAG